MTRYWGGACISNNNSSEEGTRVTNMADSLGPIVHARETGSVEWQPKAELMAPLIEMGLTENSAKRVIVLMCSVTVMVGGLPCPVFRVVVVKGP